MAAFENLNVISIKDLRSLAGRCNDIASLIFYWRPFLASLWGALRGGGGSGTQAGNGGFECSHCAYWRGRLGHWRDICAVTRILVTRPRKTVSQSSPDYSAAQLLHITMIYVVYSAQFDTSLSLCLKAETQSPTAAGSIYEPDKLFGLCT